MKRIMNSFLIANFIALSVFMFNQKSFCAEEKDLETYKALADEFQDELQLLKNALLEGKKGGGEGKIEGIGVEPIGLEATMLKGKLYEGDLEEKLIRLIIMEKNEDDREKLKEKLKELRRMKKELEEEKIISDEELKRKIIKRTEEDIRDDQWREDASSIERSYEADLPMDIPRRLEQFGYDIFPKVEPEYKEEKAEKKEGDQATGLTELLALEKLKETLGMTEVEGEARLGETQPKKIKWRYFDKAAMSRAVGPDYILGPGDVLRLRMWGAIEGTSDMEVDEEGRIFLPKKGPIYVWGKKFEDVKDMVNNYVAESYSNVQSEVTMGRIKTVQIFVLGDVNIPGAHLLTLQNTVFHALYSAGGPKKSGSLRSIKLIRQNGEKIDIDLYKLLLDGDKSIDAKLSAGDIVFVPSIGDVVGIAGSVKRPAIYEMKSPLKVSELLRISGGLMPMGYGKRLQVERVEHHTKKVVVDLNFEKFSELESSTSNIMLQNGDLTLVFPVIAERENSVKISGAVKMPGIYELKSEMTVRDLIESAEGLKRGAYLKRAEIARFKNGIPDETFVFDVGALVEGDEAQNIKLEEFDEVIIYEEKDVITKGEVYVDGFVYKPGAYTLSEKMKVSDLLFLAGGLRPSASLKNAELFKIVLGQRPQIINIDLEPIINDKEGARDLLLNDGDHLFIREATEWVEKKTITLLGEIRYPGVYAVRNDETLSSVIARAGGFTENAFLQGAIFTRLSVKEAEEKAKKRFIKTQERYLLEEEAALSGRLVYSEEERAHRRQAIAHRRELLDYLAESEVPGRLLINIAPIDGFKGTGYDIPIEEGDKLYIPAYPSYVQILGGVYNPSSITYQPGRGVEYYLEKVGGLSAHADKNRIYIVKANGETKSRFTRAMIISRGDMIVVPESFKYTIPPGVLFKDALTTVTQLLTSVAIVEAITE